jgi:hypothetical protein
MNLKQRVKRLEENHIKTSCFCNKTLVDLLYGEETADMLTHCPKCKEKFDWWERIIEEAKNGGNLTDEHYKQN